MAESRTLSGAQYECDFEKGQAESAPLVTDPIIVKLPSPEILTRKPHPIPSEVFPTYWKFAALRQKVFFARVQGRPELSPRDPIITRHRFTNAYRASDRVSQYLIRNVIYNEKWEAEDLFFRVLLFKFFNKIGTWEALIRKFDEITWRTYSFDRYDSVLSQMMENGEAIYSAAYIMASGRSAYGYPKKHQNHLRVIEEMMRDEVPQHLRDQKTLKSVFELLQSYPCIGRFTGYQYAIDLNYSELVNFPESEFVEAGPGALDGIAKCFSDTGDYSPAELIKYMTDAQEKAFEIYAPDFQDLWGRPLQLIDCQNLFCEVDKYSRMAHPDVTGRSNRKRIKQIYRPSPNQYEVPWYPPKWGLNERISAQLGGGTNQLQLSSN